MPTAAELYNFAKVEQDGKNFISEICKQCKVHDILHRKTWEKMGRRIKLMANVVNLINKQHNFVINQRVHISSYRQDIIKLQSDVIVHRLNH